ncbi:MAG: pitrilysin family protein [Nanoarchaeota archaeon]|nr:pitrilysin family protein [Nanoarchaeota archaeon]
MNEIKKSLDKIVGAELYHTQLECGLNAYFVPLHRDINFKLCHLFTRFGSIDEKFYSPKDEKEIIIENGTAHFLEHCSFYTPDSKKVLKLFSDKGVYANAWTSNDHTTYYFHTVGRIYSCLDLLINFVSTPGLTSENVEKEKKVITQEIAISLDEPWQLQWFNIDSSLFKKHPLRKNILGDKKSIQRIDKDMLLSAYTTFYAPSNLHLVMFIPVKSGSTENVAKRHFETAENICDKYNFEYKKPVEYIRIKEPKKVKCRKKIGYHNSIGTPIITFGFKGAMGLGTPSVMTKNMLTNKLLMKVLTSGSSKAIEKLMKKSPVLGNIYGNSSFGRTFNALYFIAQTSTPDAFEEELIKTISSELKGNLSRQNFELAKKMFLKEKAILTEAQLPDTIGSDFVKNLAADLNPLQTLETLASIRYEDILEAGNKYLTLDNYSTAILLPKKQ